MLKKLILLTVSLAVTLVGIEIALRVWHGHLKAEARIEESNVVASNVPGLYYEFAPEPPDINSRGFYDIEHSLEKPEGVFRIVVIGDSVAAGQTTPIDERFTRLLEKQHNASEPDRPIEVIVLARSGYCTAQELVILNRHAMEYDPDLILWSYVLNDPADPFYHGSNGNLMLAYDPPCHLAVAIRKGLIGLSEMFADERADEEYHRRLHLLYRYRVTEAMDEIGRFSKAHDVPVVVLIHPVFDHRPTHRNRKDMPYFWQDVHDDLREIVESRNLRAVDLQGTLRDFAPAELSHAGDPWHPNEKGHRLIAEWLLDHLDLPRSTLADEPEASP